MRLHAMTAHELHDLLVKGEITSREITEDVFERIEQVEDQVRAYLRLQKEAALAAADAADEMIAVGNTGPLTGIPVAVKDNMCTKNLETTCASRMLENFIPPYDATVVEKVKWAGMPIIGKTNMDEFAMGSSTENSGFGPTHNPWDTDRVPGGSSGGSAAAVASDETILALGSDTGGSIRQPAAFCGIVGMKPTYGLVSRYGLVAFASSLDQIGPMAKDVRDCALLLQVIAGKDKRDSTSLDVDVEDYSGCLGRDIKGLTGGVPREYLAEGVDPEIRKIVMPAVSKLESAGMNIEEVSLPHTEYALETYYLIAPAEASSNLARYDGVRYGYRSRKGHHTDVVDMFSNTRREGFGDEVKRRIMLGTYALSAGYYDAYYLKAQKVRTLIRQDFDQAFAGCDVLLAPVTPSVAFKLGEKITDPMQMYLSDVCTITANLAGIPAVSVPVGISDDGLPVGLQIMGKAFAEGTLLQVAYACEQMVTFERRCLKEV